MALCRCLEKHNWPKGRTHIYVAYTYPLGYPETASLCGLCDNPGVIWLTQAEAVAYALGTRIFAGSTNSFRIMVNNNGLFED